MVKLKETKKQLMKLPLQTCGHETRITETWGRLKLGPRNLCRDCARFMHCSTISVYFLHEFEAKYFGHHLEAAGGNVAKAARLMRMDRSHLFTLLREHPNLR